MKIYEVDENGMVFGVFKLEGVGGLKMRNLDGYNEDYSAPWSWHGPIQRDPTVFTMYEHLPGSIFGRA